jgi:hypothetical protein
VNFLKLDSGDWVFSRAEIGENFTAHFSNLFTSSNSPIEAKLLDLFSPIIFEEENVTLCSIPSKGEVLAALDSLGSTKATGLDGFIALFYKKYRSYVKVDVLQCIWNFFKHNFLLRDQNHTFIALVPKLSGSHTTHQFRPISLCNIVYKIISKILSHEILHTFKSKIGKGSYMFLKMDMEKAFDRMEWTFLLSIMEKLVLVLFGSLVLEFAFPFPPSLFY